MLDDQSCISLFYFCNDIFSLSVFIVLRMSTLLTKDQKFRNSPFSVSINSDRWFTLDATNKSAQSLSISAIAVVFLLFIFCVFSIKT